MRQVFADAGYWIAMLNLRDELHDNAVAVTEHLGEFGIVTTEMVLVEVLNFMAGAGEDRRKLASRMVERLEGSPDVEVVPQTGAQFRAAVARFASTADQRWSLTDCASFLVLEERNITEALAYDRDFEQAGFVALLRENQV